MNMYVCVSTHSARVYMHMYICICIYMCIRIHMCVYVCIYIYLYIIFIYTCIKHMLNIQIENIYIYTHIYTERYYINGRIDR